MGDKHLYDGDDKYIGRISDDPPSNTEYQGPIKSCFLFFVFGAILGGIPGFVVMWLLKGLPFSQAMEIGGGRGALIGGLVLIVIGFWYEKYG